MDSRYYQNKRKKEIDKLYKDNPYMKEDINPYPIIAWGIIASCFISIILLGILSNHISEDNRNNCEKIDGKYEVVDKQFNGKVYVNVYGCVK